MAHAENDNTKKGKLLNLQLSADEWTRAKLFTQILAVSTPSTRCILAS